VPPHEQQRQGFSGNKAAIVAKARYQSQLLRKEGSIKFRGENYPPSLVALVPTSPQPAPLLILHFITMKKLAGSAVQVHQYHLLAAPEVVQVVLLQ